MNNNINFLKLSELSQRIEDAINHQFSDSFFWVIAEISGHKFYANTDRHYFDLVEKLENSNTETAKIKSKSWSDGSQAIADFEKVTGQKFQNGIQVLVQVKVEYHKVYGLSCTLYNIDSSYTLGNIEKQKQATLLKLLNDNPEHIQLINSEYFTKNKSLKFNSVIQKIALVTSNNSEGYHDFMDTLLKNQYQYTIYVDTYFSSVQGIDAEKELCKTFLQIFDSGQKYDAVVLIRGGGSKTDFMVFDTYNLSRIVARFPVPIITGIGHFQDISIVDLMAHTHTKTPTKSAEFIIAHNRYFEERMLEFEKRLVILTKNKLNSENLLLQTFGNALSSKTFELIKNNSNKIERIKGAIDLKSRFNIEQQQNKLIRIAEELKYQTKQVFDQKRNKIEHIESIIKASNPKNILKRGFAILKDEEDKIVYHTDQLKKLKTLNIETYHTKLNVSVNKVEENEGFEN